MYRYERILLTQILTITSCIPTWFTIISLGRRAIFVVNTPGITLDISTSKALLGPFIWNAVPEMEEIITV